MRDTFIARLLHHAQRDPRVFLITGDLGFSVLDQFARERPTQFLNAGVAEQNMTGLATGLALDGRIVFTYSIGNFPTLRCLEQLRNDAAYHGANVKAVAIGGGFSYGALGVSHHATEDLAIMRAIPEVTVMSPGDDWEVVGATDAAIRTPGTCYLRLDKSSAGDTSRAGENFQLGVSRRLRDGEDLTLLVTGGILGVVLEAADALAAEGIRCRVVSVHTIKPLDAAEILAASRETGGLLTIEEHVVDGGLGSVVAEICLDHGVAPRAFRRLGLRNTFSSVVGSQDYLRRHFGLDAGSIAAAARGLVR